MKAEAENNDIGEDAVVLAVKYSGRGKESKKGGEDDAKGNIDGDQESAG